MCLIRRHNSGFGIAVAGWKPFKHRPEEFIGISAFIKYVDVDALLPHLTLPSALQDSIPLDRRPLLCDQFERKSRYEPPPPRGS